jgi:hypothetical protein
MPYIPAKKSTLGFIPSEENPPHGTSDQAKSVIREYAIKKKFSANVQTCFIFLFPETNGIGDGFWAQGMRQMKKGTMDDSSEVKKPSFKPIRKVECLSI